MEDIMNKVQRIIKESVSLKQSLLKDVQLVEVITEASESMASCLEKDGKVLLCGNGGSAADAQHISAELSGRFYKDRDPLFAEALHVNSSYLTAVANDYGFEAAYARLVKAKGRAGDVLIGISCSGTSPNILNALEAGKVADMNTIGLTGGGHKMADLCDHLIEIPSTDTPRIQECHILIGHILCELIEDKLFGDA